MLQKQHVCFLIAFLFVLVKSYLPTFKKKVEKDVKRLFSEKCVCFNKVKKLILIKNLQIFN